MEGFWGWEQLGSDRGLFGASVFVSASWPGPTPLLLLFVFFSYTQTVPFLAGKEEGMQEMQQMQEYGSAIRQATSHRRHLRLDNGPNEDRGPLAASLLCAYTSAVHAFACCSRCFSYPPCTANTTSLGCATSSGNALSTVSTLPRSLLISFFFFLFFVFFSFPFCDPLPDFSRVSEPGTHTRQLHPVFGVTVSLLLFLLSYCRMTTMRIVLMSLSLFSPCDRQCRTPNSHFLTRAPSCWDAAFDEEAEQGAYGAYFQWK